MVDFSKFDKTIDVEGLKKDVVEAADSKGSYEEVPHGSYEVKITKLELDASKKGDPMVKCWFKIMNGSHENSLIFMNQVITRGFQIHIMDEFLRSLGTEVEIKFESYSQYGQMLMDIMEEIDGNLEYALDYGEKKGFNTFTITEVFEVE